ncbi:hypothetical protein PYW08_014243 [Mythimna loreyi]|uniref:Uncharacterized protein n=1 Tax=Mythimna loreyi TaxID=667449 RepID=A0ACC2R850_9NEOP|nr:hypothetical protein PYW08_014243 [Mythimna loreyi]
MICLRRCLHERENRGDIIAVPRFSIYSLCNRLHTAILSPRCDEWQRARKTSLHRRQPAATSNATAARSRRSRDEPAAGALSNAASFQHCLSLSNARSFLSRMFDIEKFILEVRERPALYDVQLAEYRNR